MHFLVTVITKDGDYEKALDPYSEHIEVKPYLDKTRDQLIKDKREDLENAKKHGPKSYADYLLIAYDWYDDDALLESIKKHDLEDYSGYSYDNEGNRYTTYNKKAKWDWYVLGGRWPEMLILKDGTRADEAQVKDIDFEAYKLSDEDEAYYRRKWDIIVNESKLNPNEKLEDYGKLFDSKQSMLWDYGTLERYLKQLNSYFTNNLLYKGKWYCADNDSHICNDPKKNEKYENKFYKIIASLNPNDYISVIDCHD